MSHARVDNFGAGPSALPESVLAEAAQGLFNFANTGIGIAEISHRSKEFSAYTADVELLLRELLDVPPTHSILFMQGGGTAQFSAVVLNLLARHKLLYPDLPDDQRTLDYILTGTWSKAAYEEAQRLVVQGQAKVNVAADARTHSANGKSFQAIPAHNTYTFSPNPVLIYYCENETVSGVQFSDDENASTSFPFHLLPQTGTGASSLVPLVADYSSSFMSRPIPRIADHAIIYAGAQKNLGPAGLTIVIVRNDCIVDVNAAASFPPSLSIPSLPTPPVPAALTYSSFARAQSMPNTPPVLSIYIAGLVLQHTKAVGGLTHFAAANKRKWAKVDQAVREGEERGVFSSRVKEGSRSWMNVVFVLQKGEEAEKRFLDGAAAKGMKGLKGHRSVGGIRVSLYNAITEEQTDKLVAYMKEFINLESTPTSNA